MNRVFVVCLILFLLVFCIYDVIKKYYGTNSDDQKVQMAKFSDFMEGAKDKHLEAVKDILGIFIPLVIAWVLFHFVIGCIVIQSASMEPTLMTGDTVFINRLVYKTGSEIKRGDIVVFESDEYGLILGKRVIGLPGDKIEFNEGHVIINDIYVDEAQYVDSDVETNCLKEFVVPAGQYFLLGDNRENSADSRYWGNPYINRDKIIGRYMCKIGFSVQFDIIERFFGGKV